MNNDRRVEDETAALRRWSDRQPHEPAALSYDELRARLLATAEELEASAVQTPRQRTAAAPRVHKSVTPPAVSASSPADSAQTIPFPRRMIEIVSASFVGAAFVGLAGAVIWVPFALIYLPLGLGVLVLEFLAVVVYFLRS